MGYQAILSELRPQLPAGVIPLVHYKKWGSFTLECCWGTRDFQLDFSPDGTPVRIIATDDNTNRFCWSKSRPCSMHLSELTYSEALALATTWLKTGDESAILILMDRI